MPQIRTAPEKWFMGDLVAQSALQRLGHGYIPWTSWSMRPAAVLSVTNEVILRNRQAVVELGAGASTLALAAAVRLTGGCVASIEHDPNFAGALNRLLRLHDLDDCARVFHVPLIPMPDGFGVSSGGFRAPAAWYDLEKLDAATPSAVDLLVVDGPPAGKHANVLVREPAVRALKGRLASSYSVYLNDLGRRGERETLRLWEEQLGVTFTIIERLALGVGGTDGGFAPTL